ncbi:MAG: FAD-linked oxidase C-terminal domain-containing protein [Elusimicrobiota bacterium]|nr:FAD-linked oxidase C-terminal domain-containing protein [Elusimicrobiota bacterium]
MSAALAGLRERVAAGSLLTSEADLAVYSYDGVLTKVRPEGVLIARSAADVRAAVAWCAETGTPFVARGAGTNLSGGCVPLKGGLVISLARLNRILTLDREGRAACVEPGVVNLDLQKEAEKVGLFYAPDPASFKVSTIGGNSAENSGGPRCLKYGVTTNHVLAVEAVMPDGSLARFSQADDGPELLSLLIGAEGTLGVITRVWTKLTPLPEEVRTLLAGFPSIDSAVEAVSALIASGVLPRCLEAMDAPTVASVQAQKDAGYPRDPAVLLIELDGDKARVERDAVVVERICKERGASGIRAAADAAERERLWEARRGAYAALSRLAPNVLVEDGVVPRDKLPAVVRRIQEIASEHRVKAYLLFHAGDGNIHPNIAFDERDNEETARVMAAGHAMLQACVELGGSLSGEHGIGLDKRDAMAWLFTPATLDLFRRVKTSLDPKGVANPDKLFPLAGQKKSEHAFVRPPSPPLGEQARHLVEKMTVAAKAGLKVRVRGASTRLPDETPARAVELLTAGMNRVLDWDKSNFTVTVEAGLSVHELHRELEEGGFHLRLPKTGGTVGGLLATRPVPMVREDLLGMRLLLSDGEVVELGGKVVKNVAGYDLARVVLGSWGRFGVILDATFKLYANPVEVPYAALVAKPPALSPWAEKVRAAFDPASRFVL